MPQRPGNPANDPGPRMPPSTFAVPEAPEARHPTARALVAAVLRIWEHGGSAALSIGSISRTAGIQVTAIYHHFGSVDDLLGAAQEEALERAAIWCEMHLHQLSGTLPSTGLGELLAAMIDDWCVNQRQIAIASRECYFLAMRRSTHVARYMRWQALWSDLWQEICDRSGASHCGRLTARFFEGESSFYLIAWRRLADRASLGELCGGWSAWMTGHVAPAAPWHEWAAHMLETSEQPAGAIEYPTSAKIARAGAAIVEREGIAGLSHRAVATEAGLTLGVVSYNVRTSAALIEATFEAIYSETVINMRRDILQPVSADAVHIVRIAARMMENPRELLGLQELAIASVRVPRLEGLGARIRYLRGRSARDHLPAFFADRTVSRADAGILASFMRGVTDAYCCIANQSERTAAAEADLHLLQQTISGAPSV